MLTDELPAAWHSDDYIREWVIARREPRHMLPKLQVELLTVHDKQPDMAEIDFTKDGAPVTRFRSKVLR